MSIEARILIPVLGKVEVVKFTVLCLISTLFAILMIAPVVAYGQVADANCASPEQHAVSPEYPNALLKKKIGGVAFLLLTISSCGEVVDSKVETSSGHRELDDAAVKASKSWQFRGAASGQSVVRVPVKFDPYQDAQQIGSAVSIQLQHFPTPQLTAEGKVPGYIPDPLPLTVASVSEAREMIEKLARSKDVNEYAVTYTVLDENGIAFWDFPVEGDRFYPSVVRRRVVDDGKRGFMVTSYRCEASETNCAEFDRVMKSFPNQPDAPPPPPPLPPEYTVKKKHHKG